MTDRATVVSQRRGSGGEYAERTTTSLAWPAAVGSGVGAVRPGPDLRTWRVGALDRLLNRAASPREGLAERIEALARSCLGLDELYQFEMPAAEEPAQLGAAILPVDVPSAPPPEGSVVGQVAALIARQCAVVGDGLLPALSAAGIVVVDTDGLERSDRSFLQAEFDRWIFPTLTPLAVDHGHPFPTISNLSLNLVARVRRPSTGDTRLARVKVPPLLPRFLPLIDGVRVVPMEAVIAAHLGALFSGMTIVDHHAFRVTRSAAGPARPAGGAPPGSRRPGFPGPAVRLEVAAGMPDDLLEAVAAGTGVPSAGVFRLGCLLQPGDLNGLVPRGPAGPGSPHTAPPRVAPRGGAALSIVPPPVTSPPLPARWSTGRGRWWRWRPAARGR
jgi:polyphosphate kinase